MSKAVIELIGIVEESFPNATFRVKVLSAQAKGHELLCHLAGRMRKHRVRILPGDRVKIEMTPYDLTKGRIVYRFRSDQAIPELEEKGTGEQTGDEQPVTSLPAEAPAGAKAGTPVNESSTPSPSL